MFSLLTMPEAGMMAYIAKKVLYINTILKKNIYINKIIHCYCSLYRFIVCAQAYWTMNPVSTV